MGPQVELTHTKIIVFPVLVVQSLNSHPKMATRCWALSMRGRSLLTGEQFSSPDVSQSVLEVLSPLNNAMLQCCPHSVHLPLDWTGTVNTLFKPWEMKVWVFAPDFRSESIIFNSNEDKVYELNQHSHLLQLISEQRTFYSNFHDHSSLKAD